MKAHVNGNQGSDSRLLLETRHFSLYTPRLGGCKLRRYLVINLMFEVLIEVQYVFTPGMQQQAQHERVKSSRCLGQLA